jgi:predicted enzyme related to lactoylglutathione lyase
LEIPIGFRKAAPPKSNVLHVSEIAFTCYPVTDMARARKFYEGILGLKPTYHVGEPGGMEWVEYDIGSGTLSLGAGAPDWKPNASGCFVALEVADFDAAIAHLKAQNAKFKMEPFPTPVCRMAFVYDTEGNLICIHKRNAGHH